jgi:hypothetical protein
MDVSPASRHEMARRAGEWARTRDPAALWPGLSVSELQSAANAIGAAAAAALRGDRASLDTDQGARVVGVAALLTGSGPLLGYWLETGALDAERDIAALLATHLAHGRARFTRVHSAVAPVLGELARAGVDTVAMKGFHTAVAYFPDPGTRPFGDVDLIVPPHDIGTAEEVLRAMGFAPGGGSRVPYKRDWRLPSETAVTSFELWHEGDPWKLELHGGLDFDALMRTDARFDVTGGFIRDPAMGGLPVRVPGQPLLLAALATHASTELNASRLLRLIELTLVIRTDRERGLLNWDAVFDLLDRSRASRFAYPALALVERLDPGLVGEAVVARARRGSTRRIIALAEHYTATAPILPRANSIAGPMRWARTPRDHWRALRYLALPGEPTSVRDALRQTHARLRRLFGRLVTRWSARPGAGASHAP